MAMISPAGRRGVFLDKDGTLLEDVPYNVDPDAMKLIPGAGEALSRIARAGYDLIVVSNQSGVARGYFPVTALRSVRRRLEALLAPFGVSLADFLICPHHPEGVVAPFARECDCRKPQPGLLLRAAETSGIDLTRSWMVGDILDDVEAGCRAGCRTILLHGPGLGGETEWRAGECRTPTYSASSFEAAADSIVESPMERRETRCDAIYSN